MLAGDDIVLNCSRDAPRVNSDLPHNVDLQSLYLSSIYRVFHKRPKEAHLPNDVHALDDLSKDHVFAVQPIGLDTGDEELRAVGVGSSVGHRENTGLGMLQLEVLVFELGAVDGLASGAVVVREVATLAHEVRDDPVKAAALVAETLVARAQGPEVLGSLRRDVGAKLKKSVLRFSLWIGWNRRF